jgi:hypothetical protein
MTKEQLRTELDIIHSDYAENVERVKITYCKANNPYKIGDIFTDHIGSIKIEKIIFDLSSNELCCVYFGVELKKDLTPRKDNSKRNAWQSNDINL